MNRSPQEPIESSGDRVALQAGLLTRAAEELAAMHRRMEYWRQRGDFQAQRADLAERKLTRWVDYGLTLALVLFLVLFIWGESVGHQQGVLDAKHAAWMEEEMSNE